MMKKFKKAISMILVCAMLIGCSSALVFAGETDSLGEIVGDLKKEVTKEVVEETLSEGIDSVTGIVNDLLGKKEESEEDPDAQPAGGEEEKPLSQQPVLKVIWKLFTGAWKLVVSIVKFIINIITALSEKK